MENDKLVILWEQYLSGHMSRAEREQLRSMLQEPAQLEYFESLVTASMQEPALSLQQDADKEKHIGEVLEKISSQASHRIHFLNRPWLRYAAAITLILGACAYLWLKPSNDPGIASNNNEEPKNIRPGGDKAILTLADGSVIILDSAANGALASQGNSSIVKLSDGSIAYSAEPPIPSNGGVDARMRGRGGFNTMRTPHGGKYQLTLPDGTKAWLNAVSSITFPVTFTGKERTVKITGEVYFEVTPDKSHPFSVENGNTKILVLGTDFNVNAYEDEKQLKVTLLQGSVKVSDEKVNQNAVLVPGQQAQLANNLLSTVNNVDLTKVMAWKNGLFNFEDASLDEVMRQISRWYDIKIIYEKNIPNIQLWGKMSRNTSLTGLLNNLKDVGVKYRINEEKRELVILP